MPPAKVQDDYLRLASRRAVSWLGPFPKNTKELTRWKCSRGHEFDGSYNNVDRGMNCRWCVRSDNGERQRHSPMDYDTLARTMGFNWLGPAVSSALAQTVWECAEGHRWSARYNTIQQGCGCKQCEIAKLAARRRRQPGEYRALAEARGFSWLGPFVRMTKAKTEWRCSAAHKWWARFNQIQQGAGCPNCSGLQRKTSFDFHDLAKHRGFKWLGTKAVNTRSKTDWQCCEGHYWSAPYSSILGGSGCPQCSGLARKQITDFRRLAEQRGFLWLGPLVSNSKTKTEWECPRGHRRFASYNAIQRNGCVACSGLKPKTPSDFDALAKVRGFRWLGPVVKNTACKTSWQCINGHDWPAAYNTIAAGHGCPTCIDKVNGAFVSKNQRLLCEIVKGELNGARVGRYIIDVAKFIDGVKIAIEYDSWFYHGNQCERDERKDQALLSDGWHVLRIRSNKLLPRKEQVEAALARLIQGERWIDIELSDWGTGPKAPWL